MKAGLAGMSGLISLAVQAEQFSIHVGDTVAEGVPGAGAGVIEVNTTGANDTYTFTGTQGQAVFFEEISAAATFGGWLTWDLKAPSSTTVFSDYLEGNHQGRVVLPEAGTYTLRVRVGATGANYVGAYSIRLRAIPADSVFVIAPGASVTNNVPAAGAGNIEVPGAQDIYQFTGAANQNLFFEEVSAAAAFEGWLQWELKTPSGVSVFRSYIDTGIEGRRTLPETGVYTLRVFSALQDPTHMGTYAFRIREIPPDPTFQIAIGQTVSDNLPAAGAGNIEVPGAQDFYKFQGVKGQTVYFKDGPADTTLGGWLFWDCKTPSGEELFRGYIDNSGEVGRKTLPETGTYTIRCMVGTTSATLLGKYSFTLEAVEDSGFAISVGTAVTNGSPAQGAGRIEEAGSQDLYTFTGLAGQRVIIQELAVDASFQGWLKWELRNAADKLLEDYFAGAQSHSMQLPETGSYTIRVYAGASGNYTGNYSFRLFSPVQARTDKFAVSTGETSIVPLQKLLCNDTSEDGDELEIDFPSATTTHGGTVATDGFYFQYTPKPGFSGTDTFTYRLHGVLGGESVASVTILVAAEASLELSVVSLSRISPTEVQVCAFGAPNHTYTVEQSTDLAHWDTYGELSTDDDGSALFNYPLASQGNRYFRFLK